MGLGGYSQTTSPLARLADLPMVVLSILAGLLALGVASLYSTTLGDPGDAYLARQHAIRGAVAFLGLFLLIWLPLRVWAAFAYPAYLVTLMLLIGVEFFGSMGGGAQRWIELGAGAGPSLRLQPSEFMKVALILALARFYHEKVRQGRPSIGDHAIAFLIIILPVALVFRQPDLGTALMLAASGFGVMVFAGLPLRFVGLGMLGAIVAAPLAYFYVLKDYQRERVLTAINPSRDPLGAGYQIQQAEIAIGSGGMTGRGYTQGIQSKLDYIPEQHTDFIFTVPAEEFGFLGAAGILTAYFVLLGLGLAIAARSKSGFGYLAAAGAVVTIAFYVVVNVGMVIGLLPVVGVPLPLISHGGTAMLTVMVTFALICVVRLDRNEQMVLKGLL